MRKILPAICFAFFFAVITAVSIIPTSANSLADLKPSGNVIISFDGLQALCFGDPNSVGVGVLNVVHHTPQLLVVRHKGTQHTELVKLTGKALDGLTIAVSGNHHGISRFTPGMANTNDFRHTIDMESDIFQKQLHLKPEALIAKIQILDGNFYSTGLSEEKYSFVSTGKDSIKHSFNRAVADPVAAINLQPGQELQITGGKEPITLAYEEGVSYQIDITNLPPADMANMNHFLYYFDLIGDKVPRYEPVLIEKVAFFPKPLLCAAVVFSKSNIN